MAANSSPTTNGPVLPTGSRVLVVVSLGPDPGLRQTPVAVPELVGRSQNEVLQHVQHVGLNAQVFNDFSDKARRGHVADQFPTAGASLGAGSEVVVLVSNGPAEKTAPTALPDVVGLREADATQRLRDAGLQPEIVRDHHANVEEGVVLAQLPSQATAAAAGKRGGSLAWLWVAIAVVLLLGAAAAAFFLILGRQVTIPDVTGLQQVHAEQVLTANGLKIGTVSLRANSGAAVGAVLQQSPQGGVEVNSGSSVDLVVSGSTPEAAVPNLVGLNSSDAKTAIAASGFVAQVSQAYSNVMPIGSVISQLPQAGDLAAPGSTVSMVVSLGSNVANVANVTLPDFTGMTQAAAVTKADSLGLGTQLSQQYSATTPAGQVVDQVPAAGTSLPSRTTIGLSISLGAAPSTSVTVPDLTGQTTAGAESALRTLGLAPATVNWDGTGKPAAIVVAQLPKAGEQVPAGGSVLLFVSSGK